MQNSPGGENHMTGVGPARLPQPHADPVCPVTIGVAQIAFARGSGFALLPR